MLSPQFRNTFGGWEVHQAARKHGIPDEDALHAATHALVCHPLNDEHDTSPIRELRLGPDRAGSLLEIVVLLLDDDWALIIHSMRMRPKYRPLLPCQEGHAMTGEPTSGGVPVTDELINHLAAEAEDGLDVETLRRRGGRRPLGSAAATVVPVRLDPQLRAALTARAEADHTTASDVIRQALSAWLQAA